MLARSWPCASGQAGAHLAVPKQLLAEARDGHHGHLAHQRLVLRRARPPPQPPASATQPPLGRLITCSTHPKMEALPILISKTDTRYILSMGFYQHATVQEQNSLSAQALPCLIHGSCGAGDSRKLGPQACKGARLDEHPARIGAIRQHPQHQPLRVLHAQARRRVDGLHRRTRLRDRGTCDCGDCQNMGPARSLLLCTHSAVGMHRHLRNPRRPTGHYGGTRRPLQRFAGDIGC